MSTTWVNFAEVREKVSLEDVIYRYYGITTLTRHGSKLIGPCPVHGGDSPRAFHAELDRNLWHCFSKCKGGGNQLDFVAKKEDIPIREAALRLQAFFLGGGGDGPRGGSPPMARPTPPPTATSTPRAPARSTRGKAAGRPGTPPATAGAGTHPAGSDPPRGDAIPPPRPAPTERGEGDLPERNPVLSVRLNLKHEHEHLIRIRGLAVETMRHFDVGYCSKGIMRGLICFPIHDEDGQLVAYAGRRLRASDIATYGKWKFPKEFRKSLVLYNLHRCREAIAEPGVILVEGFFTVLKLYEAGIKNVVASMGCELSDHQARLLASAKGASGRPGDVIVLYDGDQAGWTGAELAKQKLEEQGVKVRLARLPEGLQPDDLSARALRWLVNGLQQLDLPGVSLWVETRRPSEQKP